MAKPWVCPKCGQGAVEQGEIRTAGGFWSKFFDVQNRKFTTVTCRNCRYTEIYAADSSRLGNFFDFLGGRG